MFLAIQNNTILGTFETVAAAKERIEEEKKKDFFAVCVNRKLRKLFKKDPSNLPANSYCVLAVQKVEGDIE